MQGFSAGPVGLSVFGVVPRIAETAAAAAEAQAQAEAEAEAEAEYQQEEGVFDGGPAAAEELPTSSEDVLRKMHELQRQLDELRSKVK